DLEYFEAFRFQKLTGNRQAAGPESPSQGDDRRVLAYEQEVAVDGLVDAGLGERPLHAKGLAVAHPAQPHDREIVAHNGGAAIRCRLAIRSETNMMTSMATK